MLDALLAAEELPEEYKDRCQVRKKPKLLLAPLTLNSFDDTHTHTHVFRTFYAMTVNAKERHGSTGSTINAVPAVLTIPV